jgi:hypothetical protein
MQGPSSPFGGGVSDTVIHPIVGVAMAVAIVLILFRERKSAVAPFLLVVFLSPTGQELYIAGVHVFVLRILILVGCLRMIWTRVSSQTQILVGGINVIDKIFVLWVAFRSVSVILTNGGSSGSMIYEAGFLWDALGGYFLLRFLIQDEDDVASAVKAFAIVTAILAVTMSFEKVRDLNLFGYLGGVPLVPAIREGKIRAQGPFEHPILAGVFAATLLPMFLWLWESRKSKAAAMLGIIGCTIMVVASASSTPLLAYLAVVIGWCFWGLRKNMRTVRWTLALILLTCHLLMKAPVWFLIAHVDLVAGNSGYHRAYLIDTFVRHFRDWWLIGTNQATNWGYEMDDMSNQFVAEGETGGIATFICFVLLISRSFGRIGKARKLIDGDAQKEWFLWFLGICLFSHCVGYFGISYFDQTRIWWYALLAIISAATAPILAAQRVTPADIPPRYVKSTQTLTVLHTARQHRLS